MALITPVRRICLARRHERRQLATPLTLTAFAVAAALLGMSSRADAAATSTTFTASADAYVSSAKPNTNFGASSKLHTDTSPTVKSYLRFTVSGLSGPVTGARLRLYATASSRIGVIASTEEHTWTERGITYANAPLGTLKIGGSGPFTSGTWASIDVSSVVTGNGTYSFVVRGASTRGLSLDSREAGSSRAPRLVVATAPDVTAPTTPGGLAAVTVTASSALVSWSPSSDDVGVTSYTVSLDGEVAGTTAATSYSLSGLACGATHTVTVTARDAAGNISAADSAQFSTSACSAPSPQPSFPIRAAFYYPWYPQTWKVGGDYTHYHPTLGYYSSSSTSVIRQQIAAMQYGNIDAGIISWWGQGSSNSDAQVPTILSATAGTGFHWAFYYEPESTGDPSASQISTDLQYLQSHYGTDPGVLRVNGRMVVFVYADGGDGCGMVNRWLAGNSVDAYLVLKVFPGYTSCAGQPDSWHQYAPAAAEDSQAGYSYSISPGFWKADEASPRLARNPSAFQQGVRDMVASGAPWQLVTTFNEWGEGTAVEDADSSGYGSPNIATAPGWDSTSGYGAYLDALHANGRPPSDTTPPTAPGNLSVSGATQTSVTLSWSPSSDNTAVAGYDVYAGAIRVATVAGTSYTISGLQCGTTIAASVDATDGAGNTSPATAVSAATAACQTADTQPPTAPGSLAASGVTATGLTLSWSASTDDTGVTGYTVYRDGAKVADTTSLSTTLSSLSCGTAYTLGVEARDAAGNVSPRSQTSATTAACVQPPPPSGPCNAGGTPPATYDHVIWIWFENHTYTSVLGGNSSAPYFNALANQCGYSTQWMDNLFGFNSEPEYLAGVSGSNCDTGFGSTGTNCNTGNDGDPSGSVVLNTRTIFDQVTQAGGSWKAYQEGMPSNCAFSSGGSKYAAKHNPAVFFSTLTGGSHTAPAAGSPCTSFDVPIPAITCPSRVNSGCTNPSGAFLSDLQNDTLPTFSFVTPNLCNDMHDCSPTVSDNWIRAYMSAILASPAYAKGRTAVFLMWDEGSFGSPQPNIVVSPTTNQVASSATMNNLAALRTTEDMLGLSTHLGCASGTAPGGVGTCPTGSSLDLRSVFHL